MYDKFALITENREPRTENREPRTENREPRTLNSYDYLEEFVASLVIPNEDNLDRLVRKMVIYIHNHLFESFLTRENVAFELDVKSNDIFTDFSRQVGFPPAKYINKLRFMAAGGLLIYTTEKVCDIASIIHRSNSQFNKQFKRIYGITPKNYRELQRNFEDKDNITG